jgi:hypothetical protein
MDGFIYIGSRQVRYYIFNISTFEYGAFKILALSTLRAFHINASI